MSLETEVVIQDCLLYQEKEILGSLINDGSRFEIIDLEVKHFIGLGPEGDQHTNIYKLLLEMKKDGKLINSVTFLDELSIRNLYDSVCQEPYVFELLASSTGLRNTLEVYQKNIKYQEKVREFKVRIFEEFEKINTGKELRKCIQDLNFNTSQLLCSETDEEVCDYIDIVSNCVNQLTQNMPQKIIKTGFRDLDNMIGGFEMGTLNIIAAKTGGGKSTFAQNIAVNNLLEGKRVLFCQLEMKNQLVVNRIISQLTGIEVKEIKEKTFLKDKNKENLYKLAIGTISNFLGQIRGQDLKNISDFEVEMRRYKKENPDLSLIIVDYLQQMSSDQKNQPRYLEVSEVSRRLMYLAEEIDTPILALSQLNESSDPKMNNIPDLSSLRESRSIGHDAHLVLFVHERNGFGDCSIIVGKNRDGETGEVKLLYQKHYYKFSDMPDFKADIVNIHN